MDRPAEPPSEQFQIVKSFPPNIAAIRDKFPFVSGRRGLLFTYGSSIHNPDGVEIVKFETDTGWATSSAPRLDLIPQDMKTKLPTNMRDIKTGKKIIQ